MKYEMILYWSEDDNAYIAEVPELAGCMADGPTAKEALHNVEQIARVCFKTVKTPSWGVFSRRAALI